MKKQIVQVSLMQSAKVMASLYFVTTLPLVLLMVLSGGFGASFFSPILMLLPAAYAVCGFLGTLLAGWIYNLVAARIGGIEFQTVEVASN